MPQQRIHPVTAKRLARLKESINAVRSLGGDKLMTTPDIIESIVEMFELNHNKDEGKIENGK